MIAYHAGCKPHEFQDNKYGKGYRVVNPKVGWPNTTSTVNCTVCSQDFSTSRATPKKEKKR